MENSKPTINFHGIGSSIFFEMIFWNIKFLDSHNHKGFIYLFILYDFIMLCFLIFKTKKHKLK